MNYYYNPEVKFLLINQSEEKVDVVYDANHTPFPMPLIGKRPPYYAYPRYEAYYPVV